MQTLDIAMETTAHPRARKFVLDRDVRTGEAVRFAEVGDCAHVPLAVALLGTHGVAELNFAQNTITVTAARGTDWSELEGRVRAVIAERLEAHDPEMRDTAGVKTRVAIGDLATIDGILEQTIRPYIRSHGGEVDVLEYDAETKRLLVSYLGTCGHCPASTSGTLEVIQQILREQFDPEIRLEIV